MPNVPPLPSQGYLSFADEYFDGLWRSAARQSVVDSHGSAQYRRVRAEWERIGRPLTDLRKWIRARANSVPSRVE